jgi:hypothetical protein
VTSRRSGQRPRPAKTGVGELPRRILLYGVDEPLPAQTPVRAGPLSLLVEDGAIRRLRLGNREVLRHVYVAVRDRNWATVCGNVSNVHLERDSSSFRLRFSCAHRDGEVDFRWTGTVVGSETGTISFAMDGEARATFLRHRLGFNVLHSAECAGTPFTAAKADGSVEHGVFPELISPHQPVSELRAIAHEVVPGVRADVRLTGDLFEMEDQRNWTDASFKTYSSPLRRPSPVRITQGSRLAQSVALGMSGSTSAAPAAPSELSFHVGPAPAAPLPRIGLGVAGHSAPLGDEAVRRLRALRLAHLRVDLVLSAPDHREALSRAVAASRALDLPLEVALFLSDAAEAELAALTRVVAALRPRVAVWLVFHIGERSTSGRWVELARRHLRGHDPAVRIGAGTNMFFAELNRGRPPVETIDVACYSITPQCHAFDNTTLVENLQAQSSTVESARQFTGGLPLAVTPVTLRRRSRPGVTMPEPEATGDGLPSQVDVRQMSLFGAAWTAGSLKHLAESQAATVTYFETTGWRGVMERETGCPLPVRFPSRPGWVFPLYHVLADVGEWGAGWIVPSRSTDPLRLDGLAIRWNGRTRVVLASLGPEPVRVSVHDLDRRVHVRSLDETSAEHAMRAPEHFRAEAWELRESTGGRLDLDLLPYAVVTIDTADDGGSRRRARPHGKPWRIPQPERSRSR